MNAIAALQTLVAALQASGVKIELRINPVESGAVLASTPEALDNIRAFLHASDYFVVQAETRLMEHWLITFSSINTKTIMQKRLLELCDEWGFTMVKESLITGQPNNETPEYVAQGIFVGSLVAGEAEPTPGYSIVAVLRDPIYRQFLVTNAHTLSPTIDMNDVLPFLDGYLDRFEATQA